MKEVIYYIGIGINFFLLLILLSKKGKNRADNILAAWLFVIAIHTLTFIFTLQPVSLNNIHLIMGVSAPFPLIHGPFLYLYTAASTNMFPLKRRTWLLHFLPFLLTVILLLPLFLKSGEEKLNIYRTGGNDYRLVNIILVILIWLSGLIYIIWSFVLLNKHKKNIGQQFSYEEKINLNWLRYLIYGILVIWLIIIIVKENAFIFGAGVVFVTLLGFLGIRQVGIFSQAEKVLPDFAETDNEPTFEVKEQIIPPEQATNNSNEMTGADENLSKEPSDSINSQKKYAKSGLSVEKGLEIHQKLIQAMEVQKLFTEPELSLSMLAEKISVHPNYLSQVINEREGKSFFDYINNLRVEEFKLLMTLPESNKFTMFSLAYECGFNSKSSFNKNFKKVTGQAPSAYFAVHSGNE
ncbi:MAG: AraC family transcriptional regulator [Bacteroidetes bacterium]|nr:AraC family transcriptional regulator [Bacteroidota bacterium]